MKKVGIIIGSTRPGRRSKLVAAWLKEQLAVSKNIQFSLIDLKGINLPFLDESKMPALEQYTQEHTKNKIYFLH